MFMVIFEVFGGLALFIFGLSLMTDGLRQAAGNSLRTIIGRSTRNRFFGVGIGTLLGLLMHSSGATVMYVGFINAGLMTLMQSVPLIFGANIGTSLSMQLISIRLGDYAYMLIALGFLLRIAAPRQVLKHAGTGLLGFGILFLGMNVMSGAIAPHRELLLPYLAHIDGTTFIGMVAGVGLAALFTGIIQSSGAMIGMAFALIGSGVLTNLTQVYPIVLGAHIGTCITAILASTGTNINARRCALAHLSFNIVNVTVAILAAPLLIPFMQWLSTDLTRQAANLHTTVMILGTLVLLPITRQFTRLVERLFRSATPAPEPSYLDRELLARPESAISAVLSELRRVSGICQQSLVLNRDIFKRHDRTKVKQIRLNEQIVDEVKIETRLYLLDMTRRYLSRRQTLFIENLQQVITHIERIHDHLDALCDISAKRHRIHADALDEEANANIRPLLYQVEKMLYLLRESFHPENARSGDIPEQIVEARRLLLDDIADVNESYQKQIAAHTIPALRGLLVNEYLSTIERLTNHAQVIANYERQADWRLKRKKLDRVAPELDPYL